MTQHTSIASDRVAIGVLAERMIAERRVALVPADIKKLVPKAVFVIETSVRCLPVKVPRVRCSRTTS